MSAAASVRVATSLAALLAFVAVGPPASAQGARWRDWPSSRPPRPGQASRVTFPPYEMRTLANGLRVVAVSHHEQPAVTLRLLIRAGAAQDPQVLPGVANLTAALLDQGTTSRSAQQVADTIDFIGGGLGTGAGSDLSFANVVVMKDSFALGLDLLSDIVRNPAFAPDEIERQREQAISGLKVSYDDPGYVASSVHDRLVYGFHPYGLPGGGTPESMARITRDDLVAFHARWFVPNNAILAIVGDVTAEEAFAGAERALGPWPRREVPLQRSPEPPEPTRRVVVVDRPGAVQTEIRLGHVAIPRKHPDYLALDLAVRILGGEGANRLQQVLRTQRGLTYAAEADLEAFKQAGGIVGETTTRSAATGEALRAAVDEFWRLVRDPVSTQELADAQAYLSGHFPLTVETPDAIAMQVLNALFYELDVKELETYRERVNAVTVDDIQRVARTYLRPGRLSIVLVGDAGVIGPQLKGAGFPEFERVALADLDLTTADFRRARGQGTSSAR